MTEALVPTKGVRVLLELERAQDDEVVYRMELHAPLASFVGRATIAVVGGAISFSPWAALRGEGEPEAWTVDSARAFLRTLHKNHAAARDWPRRQLRWRERK
jgi:hypothetical protein